MWKYLVVLFVTVSASTASSQTRPHLAVGMTFVQVHAKLGQPHSYYAGTQHYSHFPSAARGNVLECWEFRSHGHLYELRVSYGIDKAGSRLHPQLRVDEIELAPDRLTPARTVLADFAEAIDACKLGCDVLAGSMQGALHTLRVRQDKPVQGKQLEIELSNWDIAITEETPVRSLDDLVSAATVSDYLPFAQYSGTSYDTTQVIGRWPQLMP